MRYGNTINGVYKEQEVIPSIHPLKPNIGLYNLQEDSVHYADGYREKITPVITESQKLGEIYLDTDLDKYTHYVIDKTQEELDIESENKISQYKERINNYFSHMYIRALSSSMNKRSSDLNYLLAIRAEYEDKYKVSNLSLTSGDDFDDIQDTILGEMEDEFTEVYLDSKLPLYGLPITGTHLDKMYAIIVFKYEYGLNAFNSFNKFIRRFRTKSNMWLDASEFTKLDSAFAIIDTLPTELSVPDADILYNQFNSI